MQFSMRVFGRLALVLSLIGSLTLGGAAVSSAKPHARTLKVTAFDYGYWGLPRTVKAGTYGLNFKNVGREPHELVTVGLLDKDISEAKILAALDAGSDGSGIVDFSKFAGFAFAEPRGPAQTSGDFTFAPGTKYLYLCFIPNANGVPHYKLKPGMLGFITAR